MIFNTGRITKVVLAELASKEEQGVKLKQRAEARPIGFTFEGVEYKCSIDAYDSNRIKLPDGRIIAADGWYDTMPPSPIKLSVVRPEDEPIVFIFEGKEYECSQEAYNLNKIYLQDGIILAANSWSKTQPPHPEGLHIIGKLSFAMLR